MEFAIVSGESKKDIQLLLVVAEKMAIKARFLSKEESEDFGMAKAITEGKTGEYVDTDEFLKSLK